MASPVFGYSTLQIIPSLEGASAILDRELGRILSRVGDDAGQEAGERIAKGIAASDSEVAASTRQLADAASRGAGQSGEEIGREIGKGVGTGIDSSTGDLGSGLTDKLRAEGAGLGAEGQRIGREGAEGIETGFRSADLDGVGDDIGRGIGDELGGGIEAGFPDISGGLEGVLGGALAGLPLAASGPALAAGAGIGALVAKGFGDALNEDTIKSKLQASLGASDGEAARLGRLTGDLWRNNFAGSMEEAASSVGIIERNLEGVGDLSQAELRKVNQAALTTADVFEQDLGMAVNAVSQLIRTGLVDDAEEGFDLITRGLQGPINKSDDLLETLNEYSVQFEKLGIDGPQALGLISQAIEAGARDSDVAADALKEYAVQAVSGSEDVAAAYETLGLDVASIADAIARGGPDAAAALDVTLDRLRAYEDPAMRAQLATKLFGTQAEDLGDALYAMDLSTAADEIGDFAGAAEQAQDDVAGLLSGVEVFKRDIAAGFSDGAEILLSEFAEVPGEAEETGLTAGEALSRGIASGVAGIRGPGGIGDIIALWGQSDVISDSMVSNTREIQDALAGGAAGAELYASAAFDAKEETTDLSVEIENLSDRVSPVGSLFETAAVGYESFRNSLSGGSEFETMLSTALDVSDVFRNIDEELESLGRVDISNVAEGIEFAAEDAAAALETILGMAGPLQDRIASVFEFRGADAAVAEADSIRDSLIGVATEAGLSEEQITELIDALGLAKEDIDIAVKVSGTDVAIAQIQVLYDMIGGDDQLGSTAFANLEAFIGLQVAEEDFTAARDLLVAFQQDMVDGSLDNPILLAVNGNTVPAEEDIADFREGVAAAAPVGAAIGANTQPADEELAAWRFGAAGSQTDMKVGADTGPASGDIARFGESLGKLPPFKVKLKGVFESGAFEGLPNFGLPGRAGGGPVMAGQAYVVGEREAEVFVPGQSGMILNQAQLASLGVGGKQRKDLNIHVTSDSADGRRIGLQVADYLWLRDN